MRRCAGSARLQPEWQKSKLLYGGGGGRMTISKSLFFGAASLGALTLAAADPASAQAAKSATDGGDRATTFGEVVVTARRREERLQDVPVSANVMNADMLARYSTTNATQLATQIPQVNIESTNAGPGAVVNIRGIGTSATDSGVNQAVTVNIDGVPISRGRVIKQALFDLDSVEVLKGPQALFFGKNSPAGVITLNSKGPGDEFNGYLTAGYEFKAREHMLEGAVSAPLSDTLRVRLAGRYSKMEGGYIKNVGGPITNPAILQPALVSRGLSIPRNPYDNFPGEQSVTGRATVNWTPSETFDATVKVLGGRFKDRGPANNMVLYSCGPGQTNAQGLDLVRGGFLNDPHTPCSIATEQRRVNAVAVGPNEVVSTFPRLSSNKPFNKVPYLLGSATLNFRPSEYLTLTSVTGYYWYRARYQSNSEYSGLSLAPGVQGDTYKQFSQELYIQTNFDGSVNFTGGVFYSDARRQYINVGMVAYVAPDPVTGQWNQYESNDHYKDRTFSVFGELRWDITDKVQLAGGARYTSEKNSGDLVQPYVRSLVIPTLAAGQHVTGSFTDRNVSPQATLSYRPSRNLMIYGAYKTGFKAGGVSSPAIIPPTATFANQSFGEEKVSGYEVGAKFSSGDFAGDVTAYHYKFTGLQLSAFNAAVTAYFTQNAGSATQDGIEANLRYRLSPAFEVHGNVGYNRARYSDFTNSQCWNGQTAAQGCVNRVQNLTGQELSRAPDWVALGGLTYETFLGGGFDLQLSADVRYSSSYSLQPNNNPYSYQDHYATLDMSARLTKGTWELALIGRNLTNVYYANLALDKPLGPAGQTNAFLGQPRTVTLQLSKEF
jgi:iron complex outermembrane receptor protein